MTQSERRIFLINRLIAEQDEYSHISIPTNKAEQKNLLRSLMNVRMPKPINNEFLTVQDEYLRAEIEESGITDISDLEPIKDGIYLWQGDITTLKCGAIVNAANSRMLGCFVPCHKCIDNAIHTYAGVQLRAECEQLMQTQGYDEPTGKAKITKAYNLPCDYIIHTVGPIVSGKLTKTDCELLTSCYRSCLEAAERNNIKSIAFCGWHKASERYENFLRTRQNQKVLFLELGVGYNTPVIIKYPFWQMTAKNPQSVYACINYGESVCPKEIESQSICINADIGKVLENLR